jgi:dolichol kinase
MGSLMIVWMRHGRKIPVVGWFERTFEREGVRFPGYGAFWYVVGSLIFVLFVHDAGRIAAMLVALALGDSASTIIGIRGGHPLFYNRQKTLEGSIAFFVLSLPVCLILGIESGLFFALLMAIVEGLPLPIDDNLMIPVASMLFFAAIT